MNGYGQCFPDEEKGLTEILKNNKTISELIINTNDTQDAGLIKIAELIKGYRNITSLEYNRGKISCLGAKAIAEAILENQSMIKIKLGKVEDFETYELILNSLKQNNYITHVSICFTTGTELGFNNRNNEYSNQSLYYSFNKAVYGFATNHHSFTKRELIELLEKDKIFIKSQLKLQPALLHYEDINGDRFWFEPKQIFSLLKKYKNEKFLKLAHVVKEKVIADKDYTTEDVQFIELMNNYLNLEKIDLGKFVLFSKLPKEIQTYIFSFCKLSDIKEIGLLGSLQSEKE
ncbi:MAG: hypothetical protein K0Q51_1523 [Rickettsiaceae bacterium]|jgi:hypothetical protein|nr:hypothetical protein [Rickettsiaceae bacterium]